MEWARVLWEWTGSPQMLAGYITAKREGSTRAENGKRSVTD
jgi:hypothetical protein